MELRLSAELQEKVERAAAENNSDAESYVKQLLERYLDYDLWFRQQVEKGLNQLDRGESRADEEPKPEPRPA